ncbi:NADP-dependent oxidoreductase [Actinoplanes sp. M2I2]|uniref:NADP-dependent oxidoreductase n=1 Tax=Actinoplanes sp. M2I2 TaxID=1734444 RepID=UPI002020BCA8|nr:NADP-dependent oxidoreductase [Actinoplanes sp. M2I2]
MKALAATAYGPPENLSLIELDVPRPGPGQMLVRIAASSLNPTDLRVAAGDYRAIVELTFPYVLGNDFAGTVTEVGAGVTAYEVGDEVFGQALPRQLSWVVADHLRPSLSTGALAEYAVVEADTPLLAHRPAAVPAEQAAALGITGLTALSIMAAARVTAGESVLVVGATGGVGTQVVPLLAAAGAMITATAGNAAAGDALRELGADRIISHDQADYPSGVDVLLDLTLPVDRLATAARSLRAGGRLITIIFPGPTPEQVGRDDVDVQFLLDPDGVAGGMRDVAEAAEKGLLRATIAHRFPFDQGVQAATAYAQRGKVGKIVVTM